jgi:hypothetical protein
MSDAADDHGNHCSAPHVLKRACHQFSYRLPSCPSWAEARSFTHQGPRFCVPKEASWLSGVVSEGLASPRPSYGRHDLTCTSTHSTRGWDRSACCDLCSTPYKSPHATPNHRSSPFPSWGYLHMYTPMTWAGTAQPPTKTPASLTLSKHPWPSYHRPPAPITPRSSSSSCSIRTMMGPLDARGRLPDRLHYPSLVKLCMYLLTPGSRPSLS